MDAHRDRVLVGHRARRDARVDKLQDAPHGAGAVDHVLLAVGWLVTMVGWLVLHGLLVA
jgi:hypothetical protein